MKSHQLCKRLRDGVIMDKRRRKILCDGGGDGTKISSNGEEERKSEIRSLDMLYGSAARGGCMILLLWTARESLYMVFIIVRAIILKALVRIHLIEQHLADNASVFSLLADDHVQYQSSLL
ncbi:hypothetical protein Tco_0825323 [Tanacetum coccineum]